MTNKDSFEDILLMVNQFQQLRQLADEMAHALIGYTEAHDNNYLSLTEMRIAQDALTKYNSIIKGI